MTKQTGRLTLPTDADIVEETIRLKNLLGADALRDCDGTEMPDALLNEPVKKYATYYTTRKDNAWAEQNPEEIQQEYLISNRVTARSEKLCIRLMEGFHTQQLKVNTLDDPKRWWEVIDRTTGEVVSVDDWEFKKEWEEVEIQEKEAKENQNQSIEEMKQMSEEMEKDHQEEIENPFDCMEQIEANGIISYVLPKDKRLSGKEINRDRQVSVRIRVAGRGNFPARKNLSGTEERLLFNEYVLKNLENAAGREAEPDELEDQAAVSDGNKIYQEERKKSLDYEVEYLLAGKKSDKENLESVLMKLFLIRMGVNYICLQKDSGRKAEAEVLAVTICTLLLMPEGTEVVKQLILAAWAGGESVADLRTLLAGQRVPAIKTSENWSVSLAELPLILSSDKRAEVKETEKGLSYKDYLRILLFLKDTKEVTMRLADRIEENIRSLPEKEYFRIDQCVTKLEIENKVTVYGDISYTFPAYFGYQ